MLASHGVPIPPLGRGRAIPKDENHVRSGCRVRNTTAQNIHFVKPPPITNAVEPSCRSAIPASTRETNAADGASRRSNEMTSFSSCGVCIVPLSRFAFNVEVLAGSPAALSEFGLPARYGLSFRLSHPAGSVGDPKLDEPGNTGDRQQCGSGKEPATKAAPGQPGHDRTQHSTTSSDRCDHVTYPVDEVQECAFRLRSGLSLNRNVGRRSGPQILRPQKLPDYYKRKSNQCDDSFASCFGLKSHRLYPPFCSSFVCARTSAANDETRGESRAKRKCCQTRANYWIREGSGRSRRRTTKHRNADVPYREARCFEIAR